MNRAIILTLALLLGSISSAWAYRVIEQNEDAYELMLDEVSLPRGETGSIIFKPCAACTTALLRVTTATTYFVNGEPLEYPDFLEAMEEIRRLHRSNRKTGVVVYFDIESRRVNRLWIAQFGR